MNTVEAARQYQIAVEHERRARTVFDGVLSGAGELADAAANVAGARGVLEVALFDRAYMQSDRQQGAA